jgi:hypothetical protein
MCGPPVCTVFKYPLPRLMHPRPCGKIRDRYTYRLIAHHCTATKRSPLKRPVQKGSQGR